MRGSRFAGFPWNRRQFLKGSAAAMAAAYGLSPGYGRAAVPTEFDGSKFQLKAPETNPKSGGVLRYGITMRPRTSTCISREPSTISAPRAACSTT